MRILTRTKLSTLFESVVHGGEPWTGRRGVLSFYLNKGIFEHFRTYGAQHYNAARERMYR